MKETQLQTPQKDRTTANRRSKSTPDLNMKRRKKSLNPAFAAISEENVSEFSEETTEFSSPIVSESDENSAFSPMDPAVTSTPQTSVPLDQAPSSSSKSIITSDKHAASVASVPKCENPESDSTKNILSFETEMVIKRLTAARIQVSKSEVEDESRKLLDVLLETIIKEFHGGLYKERDLVDKLLTSKVKWIFLIVILVIPVFVFLFGESGHPAIPRPT